MANIDINQNIMLNVDDMEQVKGGVALLLPAVQKVRDAAGPTAANKATPKLMDFCATGR